MDVNYFVCTLGQAALINKDEPPHTTVTAFLEHQARHASDDPAVGFFTVVEQKDTSNGTEIFTFGDLACGVQNVGARLENELPHKLAVGETVGLLSPSTAEFMFVWLAVMRLGGAVLLLAPQLSASAIAHLCKTRDVSILIYDNMYKDLATAARSGDKEEPSLLLVDLSLACGRNVFLSPPDGREAVMATEVEPSAVAYVFHTSGTSSGLPKPIPQSHHAAIGVLPNLSSSEIKATFTTTPLYHGGISDCLRAWSSKSLIWLFPGTGVPITASNIIRCIDSVPSEYRAKSLPPVKYFTSVPYILQMMGEGQRGLEILKGMDLVGVGGAALPREVGDKLVSEGVHLVSRYGSAECGFLLSSHRDYQNDTEWRYLRTAHGMEHITLEPQDDGLSELIVRPGWPHMAKTNREDGSFATADLLEPHPSIPNAWCYHSRADAQLTLITGKKFDPSPLEGSIASSPLVKDALIFGNDQPYPGVLVFPSEVGNQQPTEKLAEEVQSIIEKLNAESQNHSKIPSSMVVIMPHAEHPLEKSSKGTILRRLAEEKYAKTIQKAYTRSNTASSQQVHDKDILTFVIDNIHKIRNCELPPQSDTDLYAYGLDSVASIQIRTKVQVLLSPDAGPLPLSIVEDCGTPEKLAQYIINVRRGKTNDDYNDDLDLMRKLARDLGDFKETRRSTTQLSGTPLEAGEIVLLTGATGALGAHVLDQCRKSSRIRAVFCLVRGKDKHSATERVNKSLVSKGLASLNDPSKNTCRVTVFPARLSEENLGLDEATYDKLAADVTVVIHLAWEVNFRLRLRNFVKDSIAGLRNLLVLALNSHCQNAPRFLYCSSTSSVISTKQTPIPEELCNDPASASPLGYSRSKWVAEQLCAKANATERLRGRVSILRVGQLAGDTSKGVWNAKEAWPMMLSTVKLTGTLPALKDERLSWLPVDIAAIGFLQALTSTSRDKEVQEADIQVLHVLNTHQNPSWMQLLEWLRKRENFRTVEPSEWVRQLEQLQDSHAEHPAMKLLGLWRDAYVKQTPDRELEQVEEAQSFQTAETVKVAPILGKVKPLDEDYCGKIWNWVQQAF